MLSHSLAIPWHKATCPNITLCWLLRWHSGTRATMEGKLLFLLFVSTSRVFSVVMFTEVGSAVTV